MPNLETLEIGPNTELPFIYIQLLDIQKRESTFPQITFMYKPLLGIEPQKT